MPQRFGAFITSSCRAGCDFLVFKRSHELRRENAAYAIDAFPGDDQLWRLQWIGGVGSNLTRAFRANRQSSLDSPHGGWFSFFRPGHQVRCPGVRSAALKLTLAYLPGDKGVHTGRVANDGPPLPPADGLAWNEPERDGHAPFPVSR